MGKPAKKLIFHSFDENTFTTGVKKKKKNAKSGVSSCPKSPLHSSNPRSPLKFVKSPRSLKASLAPSMSPFRSPEVFSPKRSRKRLQLKNKTDASEQVPKENLEPDAINFSMSSACFHEEITAAPSACASGTTSLTEIRCALQFEVVQRELIGKIHFQSLLSADGRSFLIVYRESLPTSYFPESLVPHPIRILIEEDMECKVEVAGKSVESFQYSFEKVVETVLWMSDDTSVLCPGIRNFQEHYGRFKDSKSIEHWKPADQFRSTKCMLFHVPRNRKASVSMRTFNQCQACKLAERGLKRRSSCAPSAAALQHSSRRPLSSLTPKSKKKRYDNLALEKRRLQKQVARLRKAYSCKLNPQQAGQMRKIMKLVNMNHQDELEAIFKDAASGGSIAREKILRAHWEHDVMEQNSFLQDVLVKNRTGSRTNRFSTITYRICLAVFRRSPSAYNALKSFSVLNLPSVSNLRRFKVDFSGPGPICAYLADERKTYEKFATEREALGFPKPQSDGCLIFDEVKVGMKVGWSSRDNTFKGLAMSDEDMKELHDVYESLDMERKKLKSSYVMQFLWRDLSSSYDIIGPYFPSEGGYSSQFIIPCVMKTIEEFHRYGFQTSLLICDGASNNLSSIKMMCDGKSGAYRTRDGDDIHWVKTWFLNPWSGRPIFCMICPTHQLKNMIAQLFASRKKGAKKFERDGVLFGWQAIEKMWTRELFRLENNVPRRIPRMRSSYVARDHWTRLNVIPAKIMQQMYVISELKEHAGCVPSQEESEETRATVEYLEACHKFFELGLLRKKAHIRDSEHRIVQNIDSGFQFFVSWVNEHIALSEDKVFSPDYRKFLSWQTWDLLRVTYFGFRDFLRDFSARYAGSCYISPLRLNGSAVETIFSQLKFVAGGSLRADNYEAVRDALMMKRTTSGKRGSYRNAPLAFKERPLKRRRKR